MAKNKDRKTASSYFVSTLSISLVLVIIGILTFILLNSKLISDKVMQNIGFSIIVKDKVNEVEIKKLQKILETKDFVAESTFISKAEAAKEFQQEMGEDFIGVLGYNPLLPSIDIRLNAKYANNDSLAQIVKMLTKDEMIHEVSYQKSLVDLINKNIKRISFVLFAAGLALVLISFTLIRNAIHLAVYSQRFLIKTMQLVGATSFFICRPFLKDGIWIGFFASLAANSILLVLIYFLQQEVGSTINLMNNEILIIMMISVLFCGILLSLLSSWTSVSTYLRKDINDLYN